MNRYSAFVLDDDEQVRNLLLECLRFSNFEAHGYSEAERLLSAICDTRLPPQDQPDLIVIDLQLQPNKMQGIQLVSELTERNVPSEILAISGNLPPADLVEAIKVGASEAIPKPFDVFELVKKMELLAKIGMNRRLYRLGAENRTHEMDSSRLRRPVFLSYSDRDRTLANGLRRNMEAKDIAVWYAPTSLDVGDEWRRRIEDAIDQASVFVPLITDNYPASSVCVGELMRFYRRMSPDKSQLLLLPVLAALSEEVKRHPVVQSVLGKYQYVDISVRFIDGLTALLGRIQRALGSARREESAQSAQAK
jgi:DNA-binding response OmpR family regulator